MAHPPAAFDTQSKRHKRRSSSFSEFVSRLRPSHREERGGTIRTETVTSSASSKQSTKIVSPQVREKKAAGRNTGGRWFSLGSKSKGAGSDAQTTVDDSMLQSAAQQEEISMAQRLFEQKQEERKNRRDFRQSGDYLGVQGFNPRTGFCDASLSSSGPSQESEDTKRIRQEEADAAERKSIADEEAAQAKEAVERREASKAEQRKNNQVLQQRRQGRWKMGDHGWKSVAEPQLSPIIQSAIASPVRGSSSYPQYLLMQTNILKESVPSAIDNLFPMPSARDPYPYVDPTKVIEQDDFFGHRAASSPLKNDQINERTPSISRKRVGSAPGLHRYASSSGTVLQNANKAQRPLSISGAVNREPSPISSGPISFETPSPKPEFPLPLPTLRGQKPTLQYTSNGATTPILPDPVPNPGQPLFSAENAGIPQAFESSGMSPSNPDPTPALSMNAFLGQSLIEAGDTIAISSQSTSVNQVQVHQQLDQNQSSDSPILSLDKFPPVFIKNPEMARSPLSSLPNNYGSAQVTDPAPQQTLRNKTLRQKKSAKSVPVPKPKPTHLSPSPINQVLSTPIITTTGHKLNQHHFNQLDGMDEFITGAQVIQPLLQRVNMIPLRSSSFKKRSSLTRSKMRNPISDTHETVTSSEHLLHQTKKRTAELCRNESPVKEHGVKSTPISTSTSLFSKEESLNHKVAQSAAEFAVQKWTPPKKIQEGQGGIGAPSKDDDHQTVFVGKDLVGIMYSNGHTVGHSLRASTQLKQLTYPKGKGTKSEPSTSPKEAPKKSSKEDDTKGAKLSAVAGLQRRKAPVSVGEAVSRITETAWWLVEPVFDPESNLRKRWEKDETTWKDVGTFVAAACFVACVTLMIVICGRTVGMCLRILRFAASF
ncbi:hypothetical protein BJ878DRAFT_482880 [Calycina marina]|uniref:Uncharacterized protein n=1 Tax=Calycina marina TaxID=1763456 RepID=A0A9P8CCC6_9HELO|nr:hypothetical protein BJ878DRAFT_482880 [Calycina marina]